MSSTRVAADPKRALVTGGTGFVGSNLVRRLIAGGHDVTLLVRPGHDPWRIAGVVDELTLVQANLDDAAAIETAVADCKPQWVFHLAAHGGYSWQRDMRAILQTNVLGTANLLQACMQVGFESFLNTGSSSEYGWKDHPPREDEALEPNSVYAVAKAAATWYCTAAARASEAPITTLRLYSVYGPWEEPRRFMPQLVARGLDGSLPPLANSKTARDYLYVSDACDAYLLAAQRCVEPGAVYNVGTGVQTTLEHAVELAREVLSISEKPVWGSFPDRSWDTQTWVADASLAREALGWMPSVDVARGLRLTADWMLEHPELRDGYRIASS